MRRAHAPQGEACNNGSGCVRTPRVPTLASSARNGPLPRTTAARPGNGVPFHLGGRQGLAARMVAVHDIPPTAAKDCNVAGLGGIEMLDVINLLWQRRPDPAHVRVCRRGPVTSAREAGNRERAKAQGGALREDERGRGGDSNDGGDAWAPRIRGLGCGWWRTCARIGTCTWARCCGSSWA